MPIAQDLRAIYHLAFAPIRGASHAERLDSFYRGQADQYDRTRARLLHGRAEMIRALPIPADGVWVDFGGGTGANLEHLGPRLAELRQVYIVDLSEALLAVAQRRIRDRGWRNVTALRADATSFIPPEGGIDLATFSYSLTMIPNWFAALDHARALLRPGGALGVADFYVSKKHVPTGWRRHGWWTRTFWPTWFGLDNVNLSSDHIPYLHHHFQAEHFVEGRGRLPWLPLVTVPYYWFVGVRKPAS